MTVDIHERLVYGFAGVLETKEWDRLADFLHQDAILEFPQSGERFLGLENITSQFAHYPGLDPGSSEVEEVIGEKRSYALTPSYLLVEVEGTGDRGSAIVRVRYPDSSYWYAVSLYEIKDDRITRMRTFFAPFFDAPDWRQPFREAP